MEMAKQVRQGGRKKGKRKERGGYVRNYHCGQHKTGNIQIQHVAITRLRGTVSGEGCVSRSERSKVPS